MSLPSLGIQVLSRRDTRLYDYQLDLPSIGQSLYQLVVGSMNDSSVS